MSATGEFRLYDGFHFELTPEQVKSIAGAIDELANEADADNHGSMLAQVWEGEDGGVYCCCHFVPSERANIIKEVLNRRDILAIKIDEAAK